MAKIIFNKEPQNSIHINDIDVERHIVVAKDYKDNTLNILTRESYDEGMFYFLCLNEETINGNSYSHTLSHMYKETISRMNDNDNIEVQAFTDYKEAFKWLLNE